MGTDYQEEQSSELEALKCIYTEEELTEISDDPCCFQISISSEAAEEDGFSANVEIQFTYTATYPDTPPLMEVVSSSGLSPDHQQEVETLLQTQAADNLGMVMVYTLVSSVQDKLGELAEMEKEGREREQLRKEEEAKRKEEAKFHGTPVTKEAFMEWRMRFEVEMGLRFTKGRDTAQAQKLTGRQMFERDASLALSDARFLVEASEVADGAVKDSVEVDESLFQDLEDLDIDDSQT